MKELRPGGSGGLKPRAPRLAGSRADEGVRCRREARPRRGSAWFWAAAALLVVVLVGLRQGPLAGGGAAHGGGLGRAMVEALAGFPVRFLPGPALAAAQEHGASAAPKTGPKDAPTQATQGAGKEPAGEAHGEGALHFSFGKEIMRFINFLVLVAVLVIALRKPLRSALAGRSEAIAAKLREAEEARQQALAKQREYEAKLATLEGEIQSIRAEAQRQAEAQRRQAEAEADALARRLLEQARRGIEIERQRAIDSLRSEAAALALEYASEQLARHLTAEDQQRLVDEYVRHVGEAW
ncbi:MAG: F0F1 ATP synthase subunit B [Candidatus Tectomicrobia bacterium]|nr:F0F1 ATP synthase subunit B [Candidatus Tectomicrobia bacterium]